MTALWSLLRRLLRWSPPAPEGTNDRDDSGADVEYGRELDALARNERELTLLAEELGVDLLDPDQRSMAEDILALRLALAEDIDHFDQRVNALLDDWQPGWFAEAPTTVLPTFVAVHALIDDTREHRMVSV